MTDTTLPTDEQSQQPEAPTVPKEGGSYTRDPETGALTPNTQE